MESTLFNIFRMLDNNKIYYILEKTSPDTIRINATLVGLRLEIDVFEDGHIEIARFKGDESVESGLEVLTTILKDY